MVRVHDGLEPSDSPGLAKYKEQCQESVNHRLAKLCLILKATRIDEVRVIYWAAEDDGGIEEVKFFRRRKDGKLVGVKDQPLLPKITKRWGVENEFEGIMYDIMQARGFFKPNEGCRGVIRWMIDKDMIIHDHQSNTYGKGKETGDEWIDDDGTAYKERETLYIPGKVETFYGIDDVKFECN